MSSTPTPTLPPPSARLSSNLSLVLGLLTPLCFGPLTGVPAIILGHVARSRIRRSGGRLAGSRRALAGLILLFANSVRRGPNQPIVSLMQ